jgi:hypothetical protein
MKMKTPRALSVLTIFTLSALALYGVQPADTLPGPKAAYSLNGSGKSSVSGPKAVIENGKPVPGFDGKENGAYFFDFGKHYSSDLRNITIPLNINKDKFPKITLCCWAKISNSMQRMYVLGNGTNKRNRCIITDYQDDKWRWGLNCGDDGILWGSPIVDEWTFIAAIYDSHAQEARLVINDKVFKSRATTGFGEEKLWVGALIGSIDEIKIYDRILTLAEIEALSGKPITEGAEALVIKDRYSADEKAKQLEESKVQVGGIFIVDENEMGVYSANDPASSTTAMLTKGDSIRVLEKLPMEWCKISFKDGKTGFVRRSSILSSAYQEGDNVMIFRAKHQLDKLLDLRRLNSWLIIGVMAIFLICVAIYFTRLDNLLLRLHRNRDEYSAGGSKNEASVPAYGNFLNKIYPVMRYPRYPLFTGVILGITMFVGAFWDAYEMNWFFNEGFNILPIGYDRPIHWFLYISCTLNLILILSWVVESFVIAGPVVGFLRIVILLILNLMIWLVTFCLLLLVAAIIIGLFVLKAVGSAATRRRVYYYD